MLRADVVAGARDHLALFHRVTDLHQQARRARRCAAAAAGSGGPETASRSIGSSVRFALVIVEVQAAVERPDGALLSHAGPPPGRFARDRAISRSAASASSGCMSMHSTGQGGRHSSQPVHSSVITVCICLAAPRIASTGQAWMHRVQPMHSVLDDVGDAPWVSPRPPRHRAAPGRARAVRPARSWSSRHPADSG